MILFVGSTNESLSIAATNFNKLSRLILKDDINNINNIDVGYIYIGDHTVADFEYVLQQASEIYYIDAQWDNTESKAMTEIYLKLYSHTKKVHNIDKIENNPTISNMLALADSRNTHNPQIWAVGCSCTSAVGISDEERWGELIGNQLNMPVSFLAQGGSSVQWASDQILRSDIRKDDIVVWGLTGISRFPYYDNTIHHINKWYYDTYPSFNSLINQKITMSDHMIYCGLTSIEHVILHSKQVGYQLILMQFPLLIEEHELIMLDYLSQFNFFIHVYNMSVHKFIDYGSDGMHPGPKQHAYYAKSIIDFVQKNNVDSIN